MKIEFNEYEGGATICLTAENAKDVAQLFRLTNNMKKESPSISLNLASNEPYTIIHFNKIERNKQVNSISK